MTGRGRPLAVAMFAVVAIHSVTIGNMAGFGIGWYLLVSLAGYVAWAEQPEVSMKGSAGGTAPLPIPVAPSSAPNVDNRTQAKTVRARGI
jgi:hypothetical protein